MRGWVRTAEENLDDATALIDHKLRFENYVTVAYERNKLQESVEYLVYVSLTHGIISRKKAWNRL